MITFLCKFNGLHRCKPSIYLTSFKKNSIQFPKFEKTILKNSSFTSVYPSVSFCTLENPISNSQRKVKEKTGLTGLQVEPNWKEILIELYEKILQDIRQMPENAFYRQMTEKQTQYQLDIVRKEDDYEKVEDSCGGYQVEELIEQAKSELSLIPSLLKWKPWDVDEDIHSAPIISINTKRT